MRSDKCQTREISWIDETFTIAQRGRAVKVVADVASQRGDPQARDMTVVDAGCYDGRFYWYMEQLHLYPRYVGLDVRVDYLEVARAKVPGGRASFHAIDLGSTRGAAELDPQADVVVCLEVLEHIAKPYVALMSLFMLARVGGLVVVGTPVNTRDHVFHRLDREQNLGHAQFFVHEDLLEQVREMGHELVEASPAYSLKSGYVINRDLPEPWRTMKARFGPAFRPIYLACMSEPNGGGWYIWRKVDR